jgi:hypothetical protein
MSDIDKLVQLMWDLNILNSEGARLMGVSERVLYRWLRGQHKIPKSAIRVLELELELKKMKILVADRHEAVYS